MYLAHPVFSIYRGFGAVTYKEYIVNAILNLLSEPTVKVSLPSTGRVTLMQQCQHNRYVLHLLYANTIQRGGPLSLSGGTVSDRTQGVEVIDELIPLHNVSVSVKVADNINSVTIIPSGDKLDFEQKDGYTKFIVPLLECHQMIELCY